MEQGRHLVAMGGLDLMETCDEGSVRVSELVSVPQSWTLDMGWRVYARIHFPGETAQSFMEFSRSLCLQKAWESVLRVLRGTVGWGVGPGAGQQVQGRSVKPRWGANEARPHALGWGGPLTHPGALAWCWVTELAARGLWASFCRCAWGGGCPELGRGS